MQRGRYASSRRTGRETHRHRETLQSGTSPGRRRAVSFAFARKARPEWSRRRSRIRSPAMSRRFSRFQWISREFVAAKGESDKPCSTLVARRVRPVIASYRQPTRPPWLRQVATPDRTAHVETTYGPDAALDRNAAPQGLPATRRLCPSEHGCAIGIARVERGAAWSFRPRRV